MGSLRKICLKYLLHSTKKRQAVENFPVRKVHNDCNERVLPVRPSMYTQPSTMCDGNIKTFPNECVPPPKPMRKTWLFRSFTFLVKLQIVGALIYLTSKQNIWKDSESSAQVYEKIKANFSKVDSKVDKGENQESESLRKRFIICWNASVKKVADYLTWETK